MTGGHLTYGGAHSHLGHSHRQVRRTRAQAGAHFHQPADHVETAGRCDRAGGLASGRLRRSLHTWLDWAGRDGAVVPARRRDAAARHLQARVRRSAPRLLASWLGVVGRRVSWTGRHPACPCAQVPRLSRGAGRPRAFILKPARRPAAPPAHQSGIRQDGRPARRAACAAGWRQASRLQAVPRLGGAHPSVLPRREGDARAQGCAPQGRLRAGEAARLATGRAGSMGGGV